jgi:hypothetical protein
MAIGAVVDANADVAAAQVAVAACLDTPVSCLSREELSDRLVELSRIEAQVHALRVEAIRAADAVDVGRLNDQRNAANHAAARTGHDPAEFRAHALLGKWLTNFDLFTEALRNGVLSAGHLDKLRKADNLRVHHQMQADQSKFIEWFTACQFRDLDEVIDTWLLGADPDGAEPRAHEPSVGLTVTPLPGGMSKVSGILDPLQTAALNGAINPEAEKLRNAEKEAGSVSSMRRRTLVALLNLVGRGAARPDGTFARPRVNIVMSQKVYEATIAWLADPTGNQLPEIDHTHIDKKCQLIDGTQIHPLYALAATVTATFRRIVYSARGRPIDASYDSRQIPDWMRDISLAATNGKCANPVCDAPFHWLHGDHIVPYSHTQDTSVINNRDLCGADNGWRSDDVTRGMWASYIDNVDWSAGDDLEDNDLIVAAEEVAIAQARIQRLIDASAA